MTDYTLGPWTAVGNRVYATAASGKDTMTTIEVAVATRADPRARAKVEQNARLIAAAPEMLDALRAAERLAWQTGTVIEDGVRTIADDQRGDLWRMIVAAIDKATGVA